eukprot:2925653-Pyramimonas_sp.AAC.1
MVRQMRHVLHVRQGCGILQPRQVRHVRGTCRVSGAPAHMVYDVCQGWWPYSRQYACTPVVSVKKP